VNPAKARQVVLASMASTLVIVVAAEAMAPEARTKISLRTLTGLGFGFLFLSATADFAPAVAGPLAMLVLVTSLVVPAPGQTRSAGAILLDAVNGGQGAAPAPTVGADTLGGGDFTTPPRPAR